MVMQLRKNISTPDRFDEEIMATKPRSATKPAHPALMASQVIAFDPHNPPAAFPSLSLNSSSRRSDASLGIGENSQAKNHEKKTSRYYRRSAYVWKDLQTMSAPVDYEKLGVLPTTEQKEARSRDLWVSLPVSLQYHIYKRLSLSKSDGMISQMLGLFDEHVRELQAVVALREESPASVSDIWNSCSNSNPVREDSTVTDIMDIDLDVFQQNLDAMVFASKYEVAYESEIMRAKVFLEGRNIPIAILGIWVPDCTGSEGGSEFFRHVPDEVAHLVDFNIGPGLFSGGYTSRRCSRQARPGGLQTSDLHSTNPPKRPTQGASVEAPKIEQPRPTISSPTLKRGRHPLATVTLATDPLSPPRDTIGSTQHHENSSRIKPQEGTQCYRDERTSGGMRLRNRSSIPGTRDAIQYYFDSDWLSYDSSHDEGEFTAPKPDLDTATASQIRNASFLTLTFKKKDELAKVLNGNPQSLNDPGSRGTLPINSITHNEPIPRKLVTLKYNPENFNLMHGGEAALSIKSPKEKFTAGNQHISKEPPSSGIANSSHVAQPAPMSPQASFVGISSEPTKRGRLASPAAHSSTTSEAEIVIQSIETENTMMPVKFDDQGRADSLAGVVPAQPLQNRSLARDFDRAPSFSPIPENDHFGEFQALLKAQTSFSNTR